MKQGGEGARREGLGDEMKDLLLGRGLNEREGMMLVRDVDV